MAGVVLQEAGPAQDGEDDARDTRETAEDQGDPFAEELAGGPARKSPARGPPATTTMNTPCSRPRIRSGAATCRIVERYAALTMSQAPDSARQTAPTQSSAVRPTDPTASP